MKITIRRIHWALLSGVMFMWSIAVLLLMVYFIPVFYTVGGFGFGVLMSLSFTLIAGMLLFISSDSFEQAMKEGNES